MPDEPKQQGYEPTPEQIAEECAKIRAGWSKAEELKRRVVGQREAVDCETPAKLSLPVAR